ncbi:endonuclease/exonuclease/phosphatase family protein [Actinomadura sp. BRA 177]|uniref:endonuclease/exonuclease/phosphatase family protein n=1 Tax=Actinomadura sp. BRA 177 TaxID=2745202 RepID=UPI00159627B3|nr:endonuclease/exonuclease/phosphatase family protein [Actinomadura sp. BRA 177]NVI86585.1 endonuclease/exonuclease/phosphatase family protein [Actinomadura sp. BRA 177]
MRVLTLNLWGRRGRWPERRDVIAEAVREPAPDLVAFQESVTTADCDQAADLLGPDFHLVHQAEREPDGQGISVGSRWPVTAAREVDLNVTPRTAGFACTTLITEIAAPAGPVLFVNHFPSWQLAYEHERELQAVAAARAIEESLTSGPMHVVVAGDFDADSDASSMRFWTGRQSLHGMSVCYRDCWERVRPDEPGHTYTPDNPLMEDGDWPFRRIDHILVRCGLHGGPTLEIRDCARVLDEPVNGVQASDHYGVIADLAVRTSL